MGTQTHDERDQNVLVILLLNIQHSDIISSLNPVAEHQNRIRNHVTIKPLSTQSHSAGPEPKRFQMIPRKPRLY